MKLHIGDYYPVASINCELDADDEDFHSLWLRVASGDNAFGVTLHAETPEMKALFAAINSAINMPALVRPLAELDAEAAEYEETRKVTVCEGCGVVHG